MRAERTESLAPQITQSAVEGLYREKRKGMLGVCRRFKLRPQDAEDVVQNAFLKVWRLCPSGNLRTDNLVRYMQGVVWREGYNFLNRKMQPIPYRDDFFDELPDITQDTEGEAVGNMAVTYAETELEALGEDRLMLLEQRNQGISYRELATLLGETEETIRAHVSRSRKKAKKILDRISSKYE